MDIQKKTGSSQRGIYLEMVSVETAQARLQKHFFQARSAIEECPIDQARGRVLAAPVRARLASPEFDCAAMDGIAVKAVDTFDARDDAPIRLNLTTAQAVKINTGLPLPVDKDAVIMIEQVTPTAQSGEVLIRNAVFPGQHVRLAGEDVMIGDILFPSHHTLTAADLGVLLSAGLTAVGVYARPRVAIIATGTELVRLDKANQIPPAGTTIDTNTTVLAELVREAGGIPHICTAIPETATSLTTEVENNIANKQVDILLVIGGSSAGSSDDTAPVLAHLGDILVHGVTMMPGKPTILAKVAGKPVFGLPGYPVSAITGFEQFVRPLLLHQQQCEIPIPATLSAQLTQQLVSPSGIDEYRRLLVAKVGAKHVAVPLKKGAGTLTSVTRSNGLVNIPAVSEGVLAGKTITVQMTRPIAEIERIILCTGSHDPSLDLLADLLRRQPAGYLLASGQVGSLAGILALGDGVTHIAGSHLFDPETNSYNTAYIQRYLPGQRLKLITLAHRQQGFMVRSGNPKSFQTIHDLTRTDLCMVNRQAGSGTRLLLDRALTEAGLSAQKVRGYEQSVHTHSAVALAVKSGRVDVGPGIFAAAQALGLDFIGLTEERYDIIIPEPFMKTVPILALLDLLSTPLFKASLDEMGGYCTRATGQMVTG